MSPHWDWQGGVENQHIFLFETRINSSFTITWCHPMCWPAIFVSPIFLCHVVFVVGLVSHNVLLLFSFLLVGSFFGKHFLLGCCVAKWLLSACSGVQKKKITRLQGPQKIQISPTASPTSRSPQSTSMRPAQYGSTRASWAGNQIFWVPSGMVLYDFFCDSNFVCFRSFLFGYCFLLFSISYFHYFSLLFLVFHFSCFSYFFPLLF